ncbi:MAG: hypothetical protein Q4D62_07185 [Planctomycetia bacterium]|nr:hypothetical protein [Planctomycetia bacterium]
MAKVEQGAALIAIEAEDRTNAAFLSVRENFQNFNQQIGNFEKNFRPIQELMEGGLAVSGSMAGMGALLQHSNNLGAALQGLQGRFLGIDNAVLAEGGTTIAGENPDCQHLQSRKFPWTESGPWDCCNAVLFWRTKSGSLCRKRLLPCDRGSTFWQMPIPKMPYVLPLLE